MRPAPLNLETVNLLVEHQLSEWPDAAVRYHDLGRTQRKPLDIGDLPFSLTRRVWCPQPPTRQLRP